MFTTINDLNLPRTSVIAATEDWVRSIEPAFLFNHSMRTYLFGRAAGEAQGLRAGVDYDDEVFFLGCLLHDVGLTEQGDHEQRFEVDGADLTVQFPRENGFSRDRADIVWDAIALHGSPGVPGRKRPEIALLAAGADVDVLDGPDDLPPALVERIHRVLPRPGLQNAFRDAILAQGARSPASHRRSRCQVSWCVSTCRVPVSQRGRSLWRAAAGTSRRNLGATVSRWDASPQAWERGVPDDAQRYRRQVEHASPRWRPQRPRPAARRTPSPAWARQCAYGLP